MRAIFMLSIKELGKRKFFTLLTFIICVIALNTVFSAVTNATSAIYQAKQFEQNIGYDLKTVLHLHYRQNEETNEFANTLTSYKNYMAGLDGVEGVGQFDSTNIFFKELENMKEYKTINPEKIADISPGVSWTVSIDEELLPLVKGVLSEYSETSSGYPPIYPSEIFKDIIPVGTFLTVSRTGEKYEVAGYIPTGKKWVDNNDLIRFPFMSLDGVFIAPYTEESKSDIFTQLACLHNTYVLMSGEADVDLLKQKIYDYSVAHGFEAYADTLAEEYKVYLNETDTITTSQIALAVFISVIVICSVIAVFITNTLLRRRQYGVLLANGFTQKDIAKCIAAEIGIITFFSAFVMWFLKLLELQYSNDLSIKLFRDIMLTAHIQFTLPVCFIIVIVLTSISTLLPVFKILQYQPCDLIGGDTDGND